jgi:hypothetical protein
VQCEFAPITSGHRLCLVYDLVQTTQDGVGPIAVPTDGWPQTHVRLHEALDTWSQTTDAPQKLVHPLSLDWTAQLYSDGQLPENLEEVDALQLYSARHAQLPGVITHLLTTCARFPKELLNLVFEFAPVHSGRNAPSVERQFKLTHTSYRSLFSGFEWCLALLEKSVNAHNYQSDEEDYQIDHDETTAKLVRFVDASGRSVSHLPDQMQVSSDEMSCRVKEWARAEHEARHERGVRGGSPRHYYAAVIVVWLSHQAFSVRHRSAGTLVRTIAIDVPSLCGSINTLLSLFVVSLIHLPSRA